MKLTLQKGIDPYTDETIWLMLDEDYQVVEPIQQYLTSLSTSKSPNTVESYGHDLKLWWQFLEYKCLDWHFRSHQFRRTVATVMTNAGIRDLKDYQGEFVCPECEALNIRLAGKQFSDNKRRFICRTCRQRYSESCSPNATLRART